MMKAANASQISVKSCKTKRRSISEDSHLQWLPHIRENCRHTDWLLSYLTTAFQLQMLYGVEEEGDKTTTETG
jgi:hypothetical protein